MRQARNGFAVWNGEPMGTADTSASCIRRIGDRKVLKPNEIRRNASDMCICASGGGWGRCWMEIKSHRYGAPQIAKMRVDDMEN